MNRNPEKKEGKWPFTQALVVPCLCWRALLNTSEAPSVCNVSASTDYYFLQGALIRLVMDGGAGGDAAELLASQP